MDSFIQGCICTGFIVAAVFFLRYWRETRDRLFVLFALAFFTLGLNRCLLVAVGETPKEHYSFYLVRLSAFLIIVAAIADKNFRRNPRSSGISHNQKKEPRDSTS